MKLQIQKLDSGSPVLFDLPDSTKVRDDGKGILDAKMGSNQILWFNTASGYAAFDPELVVIEHPKQPDERAELADPPTPDPPATIPFVPPTPAPPAPSTPTAPKPPTGPPTT